MKIDGAKRQEETKSKERNAADIEPSKLTIQGTLNGEELFLDEKKLKNVYSFKLVADEAERPGYAVLTVELRVRLKENDS